MKIQAVFVSLVAICVGLSNCMPVQTTGSETNQDMPDTSTPDKPVYAESEEEDMIWDPSANTFFQEVVDGDMAIFTDKMIFGHNQPNFDPDVSSGATPTQKIVKRVATSDTRFLWPDGIVYYKLSKYYTNEERTTVLKALCHWEEHTCIRFVPHTTQTDYIFITPKGAGCSSYIGRVGAHYGQEVIVGGECFSFHSALHEIGHAIGFFHEHNHPDRDEYIDINYANMKEGGGSQFKKLRHKDVNLLGVGYDYNSIMHYDHNLFAHSREMSVLVAKDPSIPVGGARVLSELDIEKTRRLYQCPPDPKDDPPRETLCPLDTEPTPPPTLPPPPFPSCGGTIDITLDQWGKNVTIESPNYPTYTPNTDCGWYVRVPDGFQVSVTVEEPMSDDEKLKCQGDYIEVFESFEGTESWGKHCPTPIRTPFPIGTEGKFAYIRYHTDASNSRTGLNAFRATVGAYDTNECSWKGSHRVCSHICTNFPGGYKCSCPFGYFLSSDGKTCFDTNECGLGNGGCDHKCVNRGGSYHCVCEDGFVLQADGRTCTSSNDIQTTSPEDEKDTTTTPSATTPSTAATPSFTPSTIAPSSETPTPALPDNVVLLMGKTGEIKTERWPSRTYPVNVDRDWLIQCPSVNQRIDLNFNYRPFGIAGSLPDCVKDWIKVYDGDSLDDELLGKFCHYATPSVRRSSSHQLRVLFHAGPRHNAIRKGFKATYTCIDVAPPPTPSTVPPSSEAPTKPEVQTTTTEDEISKIPIPACGAILTDSSGSFNSPNWPETYPTNVKCEWIIVLPNKEKNVQVTFNDGFGIAGRLPECTKDWVKIYNGYDDDTVASGPHCYYTEPETFVSSSHIAKVVLYAGPAHNPVRRGFSASYRSV